MPHTRFEILVLNSISPTGLARLPAERYHVAPLGLADDFHNAADGDAITFAEAQRMGLALAKVRFTASTRCC